MPTKHTRIAIVNDDELQAALAQAAPLVAPGTRLATLVHDLAIRGAEALIADHETRAQGTARIVGWTNLGEPPWDPEVLADVDDHAWRHRRER